MSSAQSVAPAVPLPRQNGDIGSKPPVWSLNNTTGDEVPPAAKCDRHERTRDGVCCKELIGDDDRTLVDPDVVRDV